MPRSFRAPIVVLAVVAALAAAACGGGAATPAPRSSSAAATQAPAGTSVPSAPGAGGSTGTARCDLLSAAEIKQIAGRTVARTNPRPLDTIYENVCRWTFEGYPGQMELGVLGVDAVAYFERSLKWPGGTEIAGLGDRAARNKVTNSIFTLTGDTMLEFTSFGIGITRDVEQALVVRVLAIFRR